MQRYITLYRNEDCPIGEHPFGFRCYAEDGGHAEEQCLNAEPDADVVWVVETDNYEAALLDYYTNWEL